MALSRWSQLQSSPFGSSSLRAPANTDAGQLRRRESDYGVALRLLRREARHGDARSALGAIKLQEEAMNEGIATGGIRRKAEADAGILGRVNAMERGAEDREKASSALRTFTDEALAPGETAATPPTTASPTAPADTRTNAALDIYEGDLTDNDAVMQRGLDSASRLGVRNPVALLDKVDRQVAARRTLDTALGLARTPAEVATLRERGARFGVTPEAFDNRNAWWDKNRRL